MTFYTIPYKQDGSCCDRCGLPSDPCNCPECECEDLTGLTLSVTISAGFGGADCTPILFQGNIACSGAIEVTWTPPCCSGDPPRQIEPLALTIDGLSFDPCVGEGCVVDLAVDGTPVDIGDVAFGPNLNSDNAGTSVLWLAYVTISCWDAQKQELIYCGECMLNITVNIEPCAEVYQWYCIFVTSYSGDNCTGEPTGTGAECIFKPASFIDTLPACIPGWFGGGRDAYIEFGGGPYDNPFHCNDMCPPLYCLKYTYYAGPDCTGAVVSTRTACEQTLPHGYPYCFNEYNPEFGYASGWVQVISGPYYEQLDVHPEGPLAQCENECSAQCCDFDEQYSSVTITMTVADASGTPSAYTTTFTGTHIGGGVFTGTIAPYTLKFLAAANACYDTTPYYTVAEPGGPGTLQITCDPATNTYGCTFTDQRTGYYVSTSFTMTTTDSVTPFTSTCTEYFGAWRHVESEGFKTSSCKSLRQLIKMCDETCSDAACTDCPGVRVWRDELRIITIT